MKDILLSISLKFEDKEKNKIYRWRDLVLAELIQINHPNNCHEIDITRFEKNLTGFNQIIFAFHPNQESQVEILLEDKKGSLTRTYQLNKFRNFGSRITIANLTKRRLM